MAEALEGGVEGLYKALTRDEKIKGIMALIHLASTDLVEYDSDEQNLLLGSAVMAVAYEYDGTGIADTIIALVYEGPCWAGDIPSKEHRNVLIELGLATHIIVKGEDGFTAAKQDLKTIAEIMGWQPESVEPTGRRVLENSDEAYDKLDTLLAAIYDRDPSLWREALVVAALGMQEFEKYKRG